MLSFFHVYTHTNMPVQHKDNSLLKKRIQARKPKEGITSLVTQA